MFTTSRRHHAPPLASSSSHQHLQHQPISHTYQPFHQSAPPTPSNAHQYSPAKTRPATASSPSTRPLTSTLSSSAIPHSPSPTPSPLLPQSSALHLTTMPQHSSQLDSYSSSPVLSPLSSGLPSPTFPPSRLSFPTSSANAQVPVRSAVINITSSATSTNGVNYKDDFDYRRSPQPPTRPPPAVPTSRQYSSSISNPHSTSTSDSTGSSESSPPTSPRSVRSRTSSTVHEDVLAPGDLVGEGLPLQGDVLRRVDTSRQASAFGDESPTADWQRDLDQMLGLNKTEEDVHIAGQEEPAGEFEVVRKLGSGSYAVVYLVREVLSRPATGVNDDDGNATPPVREKEKEQQQCREADEGCFEYAGEYWDDEFDPAAMTPRDPDYDVSDLDSDEDGFANWQNGRSQLNGVGGRRRKEKRLYGREYAVKCLSKAGMDEEALRAQMVEANIHQSLPAHPNIVTLHRTLETRAFLLLILEFVPGEDLFYFLEQARDHYEPDTASQSRTDVASVTTLSTTCTPPTPSLLATLNEQKLLSKKRLKLIASMFKQMCEAVAVCHDVGVYHRDIKPENFIVTDGWAPARSADSDSDCDCDSDCDSNHGNGNDKGGTPMDSDFTRTRTRERKVIVKLTDFGLSTRDTESGDMDCGSAPYMSFECRNNCAPTYAPRVADVWSLGIVLVNMLYHINPWSDAAEGICPSFSAYRQQPETFFLQRFSGMTPPVASFLAQRVFCILPAHDPLDTLGKRVSARDFGRWVRDLPELLGREGPVGVPPVLKGLAQQEEKEKEKERVDSPISPISATSVTSNVTTTMPTTMMTMTSGGEKTAGSLLAQSLAQVFAQQEQAAASGSSGPSSPAWRHRRGLSNASIGFPLSSVPQSRRPASRQASFSVSGIGADGVGVGGVGSAAGSRAATPLMRGRTLSLLAATGASGMGMSRAPSGSREMGAGGAGVSELPTVFDEEAEADLSSTSVHAHVRAEAHEQNENRLELEQENEHEHEHEHEQDQDQENEHDHEREQDESNSRSQSMVRRRKRGARKGKGQIIQQQQQEIARLQEKQADLQAQLERLANAVAAQQVQTTSPQLPVSVSVSPLSPGLVPMPMPPQQQQQQSVPQSVPLSPVQTIGSQGDTLDTLASASEALARELSRKSRSNSQSHGGQNVHAHRVPAAPIPLPLPLCAGNALTLAASTTTPRGSRSNSVATTNHTLSPVHPQNYPHYSPYGHPFVGSHGPGAAVHMRAIPGGAARDVSPARVPSGAAGGPTPGALYPVSFPAASVGSSTTVGSGSGSTSFSVPPGTSEAAAYASSIVSASSASSAATGATSPPVIAKKTSKWKLSFGKSSSSVNSNNSGSNASTSSRPPIPPAMQGVLDISKKNSEASLGSGASVKSQQKKSESGVVEEQVRHGHGQQEALTGATSATAMSVTNVLMGLNSSAVTKGSSSTTTGGQTPAMQPPPTGPIPPTPNQLPLTPTPGATTTEVWSRGRRPAGANPNSSTWGPSHDRDRDRDRERDRWLHTNERNVSPNSTRRGAPVGSSASSVSNSSYSSNWRNSTATGSSASSAFTRFSNGSIRSVSTVATSVSGGSASGSWRNHSSNNLHAGGGGKPGTSGPPSVSSRNSDARIPPPNVKIMTGVPYCLDELPRQLNPEPAIDLHPPPRKQRVRKPKDLPTINERPSTAKSPLSQRFDAARSSSDLNSEGRNSRDGAGDDFDASGDRTDGAPRKVQKGQINALAKMLSALRR